MAKKRGRSSSTAAPVPLYHHHPPRRPYSSTVPRLLPWQDWEEWRHVHSLLFSLAPGDRWQGVEHVSVWRARERLPQAIDSTAHLVEQQLIDQTPVSEAVGAMAPRSEIERRLAYSAVILRCVNGLLDDKQQGVHAMSIASLARGVGLPVWLVDLRHHATHKDMPSLSTLQLAGASLLDFMAQNYWAAQLEHLDFLATAFERLLKPYVIAATAAAATADEKSRSGISSSKQPKGASAAALSCAADLLEHTTPTSLLHILTQRLVWPRLDLGLLLSPAATTSLMDKEGGQQKGGSSSSGIGGDDGNGEQARVDAVFQSLKPLYLPLLCKCTESSYGFGAALLVTLVERVLMQQQQQQQQPECWLELGLCLRWVRLLLSREWMLANTAAYGEYSVGERGGDGKEEARKEKGKDNSSSSSSSSTPPGKRKRSEMKSSSDGNSDDDEGTSAPLGFLVQVAHMAVPELLRRCLETLHDTGHGAYASIPSTSDGHSSTESVAKGASPAPPAALLGLKQVLSAALGADLATEIAEDVSSAMAMPSSSSSSTPVPVATATQSLLGDPDQPSPGCEASRSSSSSSVAAAGGGEGEGGGEGGEGQGLLSLEEMEKLLLESDKGASTTVPTPQPSEPEQQQEGGRTSAPPGGRVGVRVGWAKCERWTPCAIGALPGWSCTPL